MAVKVSESHRRTSTPSIAVSGFVSFQFTYRHFSNNNPRIYTLYCYYRNVCVQTDNIVVATADKIIRKQLQNS